MPDTIPNIVIQPDTITDIYADPGVIAAGGQVGDKIDILLLGQGNARMYAGAVAPDSIDDESGYRELTPRDNNWRNEAGDAGLFIYSRLGCVINVKAV